MTAPPHHLMLELVLLTRLGFSWLQQIIAGLNDIVSTATTFQAQWNGISPPTTDEISRVATAFRDFSNGQQKFLNILIGKAGVFEQVPFIGQPLTGVLRQLESITEVSEAVYLFLLWNIVFFCPPETNTLNQPPPSRRFPLP